MKKALSFAEVLDAADKLSLEEQESIVAILHRRMIELRRKEIVKEIRDAQQEYNAGKCKPCNAEDIIKDILA
jgi:hypothetical protein